MLSPRHVAVVGASSDHLKFSGRFVSLLSRNGFTGEIYPVNARRTDIQGYATFPDLASIPGSIDCVVYSLAAEHIDETLLQCAEKDVSLLLVATSQPPTPGSGTNEQLEQRLARFARESGVRVLGPNSVGFVNFIDPVMLAAAVVLERSDLGSGHVGLVSQSGGVALGPGLFNALDEGIHFSHIICTGNESDLDLVDFGEFLVDDPDTHAIALMAEGIRDGNAFMSFLDRAGQAQKPVVILKSGRSELGSRMAASHTGALTGSDAVFDAVCRRYGVARVHDVHELYQTAQMFSKLRRTGKLNALGSFPASGVSALSVSGGIVGHFADTASIADIEFPELGDQTISALASTLDSQAALHNPVDLSANVVSSHGTWGKCIEVLMRDEQISIVVPILTTARDYDPVTEDIVRIAGDNCKSVVVLWSGGALQGKGKICLRESDVPIFETTLSAVKAIASLDVYCRTWNNPLPDVGRQGRATPSLPSGASALIDKAVASGRTTLSEPESKIVLAAAGFPVTRENLTSTLTEAVAAARAIGYPVALKGVHPNWLHKTDSGVVRLGIVDEAQLKRTFLEIHKALDNCVHHRASGILVQEMVPAGLEYILGAKLDPIYGPVVMFGSGGIYAEVFKDVAISPAPLTHDEAIGVIERTRSSHLLSGVRGRTPVDTGSVADLLVALGELIIAGRGLISEIDVNPIIVGNPSRGEGLRVVDAAIVLDREVGQISGTAETA